MIQCLYYYTPAVFQCVIYTVLTASENVYDSGYNWIFSSIDTRATTPTRFPFRGGMRTGKIPISRLRIEFVICKKKKKLEKNTLGITVI